MKYVIVDDTVIKLENIKHIDLESISFALEDRDCVVKAFRKAGIKCLQVVEGIY